MLVYTDLAAEIIAEAAEKIPALSHLQPEGIAVAAAPRWAGNAWGNLATCIGLREDAEPTFSIWVKPRSREVLKVTPWYTRQPVKIHFRGTDCRYLILLRLPRLLEHNPLETIIHELFHIGEGFDGALRPLRHGKLFDWNVRRLMREFLNRADSDIAELSQLKWRELRDRFGTIAARRLPSRFQPSLTLPSEPPYDYSAGIENLYPGYRLIDGCRVVPMRFTPAGVPRRITEADCSLRAYHEQKSEDLPAFYSRRFLRRTADSPWDSGLRGMK
jgi:predicted metallopeptidase